MTQHKTNGINRRTFLKSGMAGATGLALGATASPLLAQSSALASEHVCTFSATLDAPQVVGPTPDGMRQIVYTTGGTLTGSKINGTLLVGGGDWLRVRSDGVFIIDVRATVQLDDGNLAYLSYPGYAVMPQEMFGRILGGEEVDGSEYYFRVLPRFETASEQYAWLNHSIFVATGQLGPGLASVVYEMYQIL